MGPFLRQLWTVSGVLINMVGQGMVLSYSSSLMPALKAPDADIETDLATATWIVSSIAFGGIPGFLLSSLLMERYGRRIAHAFLLIPGMVGWLLIYFASSATLLLIGRLCSGFSAGGTVTLGAVIIGEYSSPTNRGMFLNLKTTAVNLGGMIVHILANFFTWRTIALISLIPNFVALIIILTWPDSPAWLATKGEFDKSKKAFLWLRGSDEDSKKELHDLIQTQMRLFEQKEDKSFAEKIKDFCKKFTKKDFLKPVFIIFLGSLLLEVSGRHIFPAFALDIVGQITGNKNQSFYYTLGLDLIITISATFSSVLVKMMKRRQLLFVSGFAAVAVLGVACTYLFLVSRDILSEDYPSIALGMFVVFFILVNLGCTPIPLSFLGELIPLEHRGAGSAVAGVSMCLALNLALQMTPFLLIHCKVYGTFTIFGACIAVILGILYFMLPETKDRTLQEIEDFFNYGKFKDDEVNDDDEELKVKMISDTVVKLSKWDVVRESKTGY